MSTVGFAALLQDITLPGDLAVELTGDGARQYIQVSALRPCVVTGELTLQKGGKRWLSEYMVASEFVRLVFEAGRAFEEHEYRENFLFRGKRVFGPHISLPALMEAADHVEMRA